MRSSFWKVFVPHELLIQPDSALFGHVKTTSQSVYITASSPDVTTVTRLPDILQFIGTLKTHPKDSRQLRHSQKPVWVNITANPNQNIGCQVTVYGTTEDCSCIIYNPNDLLRSGVLCERAMADEEPCDNITAVVKVLKSAQVLLSNHEVGNELKTFFMPISNKRGLLERFGHCLVFLITCLYFPFQWINILKWKQGTSYVHKFVNIPTVLTQLGTRGADLKCMSSNGNLSPLTKLRQTNSCVRQVVDSILGLCLMYFLMQGSCAISVTNLILSYGDTVATELQLLLDWLTGAPAGLKLNSQLTHFLGKFFHYHIYLWTGYLYLLKSILGPLVYHCSAAGVWGLSVQLALFQDIFSTLTLHIYCFYVYAARLYHLQLYALSSLWRLFRGKKWNVLRQRVDSAIYDADQLFVGTLMFTVLLFLLPTTGLYYVVFTLLRLLILSIQGTVSKLRHRLNVTPFWSLWLWLVKSPALTEGAVFHILSKETSHPGMEATGALLMSMQCTRLCLSDVLSVSRCDVSPTPIYTWGSLVSNLLKGELIYPWIDKTSKP